MFSVLLRSISHPSHPAPRIRAGHPILVARCSFQFRSQRRDTFPLDQAVTPAKRCRACIRHNPNIGNPNLAAMRVSRQLRWGPGVSVLSARAATPAAWRCWPGSAAFHSPFTSCAVVIPARINTYTCSSLNLFGASAHASAEHWPAALRPALDPRRNRGNAAIGKYLPYLGYDQDFVRMGDNC